MTRLLAFIGLAAAAGFASDARAAYPGSCESAARQVTNGAVFTVTPEYDEDTGRYDDTSFVYYFKVTLKRGLEYTAYLVGADGSPLDANGVYIDAITPYEGSGETFPATATFHTTTIDGLDYYWLPTNEWTYDPEFPEFNDPATWTYFVRIAGEKGLSAKLMFMTGIRLPPGIEDNPVALAPSERKVQRVGVPDERLDYRFRNGEFYMRSRLQAGRKYVYALDKRDLEAAEKMSVTLTGSGRSSSFAGRPLPDALRDFPLDPAYEPRSFVPYESDPADVSEQTRFVVSVTTNAVSLVPVVDDDVVPPVTNYVTVTSQVAVVGTKAGFDFSYAMLPARTVAEHNPRPLALGATTDPFEPGRIASASGAWYDEIIDDNLFAIDVRKGMRYAIGTETVAGGTNLLMRVYDAAGAVLYENTGAGVGYDCRVVFTAPSTAKCFVGVCQRLANDDEDELAPGQRVKVWFRSAMPVDGSPDAADSADDGYAGANGLRVMPAVSGDSVLAKDPEGSAEHRLGATDWADWFVIGGTKDVTYELSVTVGGEANDNRLAAQVYRMRGLSFRTVGTLGDVNPGAPTPLTFTATEDALYYVRLSVAEGMGLDYPAYRVHAIGYQGGKRLGGLCVNPQGPVSATWSLRGGAATYLPGVTVLLPAGSYAVEYSSVAGFEVPESDVAIVEAGRVVSVNDGIYADRYDPRDDTVAGATKWSVKNVESVQERMLVSSDPADNFTFDGKDGCFFDFALTVRDLLDESCDAVFSISMGGVVLPEADGVTSVHQLRLPKGKYVLTVSHRDPTATGNGGSYALSGRMANVGQIKVSKTALAVKDNASEVSFTVSRTQKEGKVRVAYETLDGKALAGRHYVATAGELVWEDGDKSSKTVRVKLIPKVRPYYEGNVVRDFRVRVAPVVEDREEDEYPAELVGGDTVTVTISQSASKSLTDPMDNYKPVKPATVKTESTRMRLGSFYGVLPVDASVGAGPADRVSALASVSLTVSGKGDAAADKLSASVMVAGRKYSLASGKSPWDAEPDALGRRTATLTGGDVTLKLAVWDADTDSDDWLVAASGTNGVELAFGTNVTHRGEIYRSCVKIQDYLTALAKFAGYYTAALVPPAEYAGAGLPYGNGYVGITVDAKGRTKVTGLLADGTKLSLSSSAARIARDATSSNGYALYIPLYAAKASSYCFGGTLRLFAEKTLDYDGVTMRDVVKVDVTRTLYWGSDNAGLSRDGQTAPAYELSPVGGYFDTVINLQAYYIESSPKVSTTGVSAFPAELFDYSAVSTQEPNGFAVDVKLNAFATAKKSLVKDKETKLVDFEASANPSDVKISLARATGLVKGSFSIWTEGYVGENAVQKEVKGMKHNGILLLSRDSRAADPLHEVLSENVISAGFFTVPVQVQDEETGKNRKWNYSDVFNIVR